jgi:hypothetical protein
MKWHNRVRQFLNLNFEGRMICVINDNATRTIETANIYEVETQHYRLSHSSIVS